jgi:ankyrin repeat protein
MRLLLQSKANVNKFWESETVLHTAIRSRNKDLVSLLLEAKANVNLKYGCELL